MNRSITIKLLSLPGIEGHFVTSLLAKGYVDLINPDEYKLNNMILTQKAKDELKIKSAVVPREFVKQYNELFPPNHKCGSLVTLQERFVEFFDNIAQVDIEETPEILDDILLVTEKHVSELIGTTNEKYIGNADTFIYNRSHKVQKSRLLDKLNAYLG